MWRHHDDRSHSFRERELGWVQFPTGPIQDRKDKAGMSAWDSTDEVTTNAPGGPAPGGPAPGGPRQREKDG